MSGKANWRFQPFRVDWLDDHLYPGYDRYWPEERFRRYILDKLRKDDFILDLGAGRGGCDALNFKGLVRAVAGVDPDPVVHQNSYLDEAKTLSLGDGKIPYNDNTFDLIFSNCVVEHVENQELFFKEAWRVLKPDGLFLGKTSNLWHYVGIIARLTPYKFHTYFNRKRGVKSDDVFPTFYKCNTPGVLRKHAIHAGFNTVEIELWDGRPEYLRVWAPAYVLGYLYERAVNTFQFLTTLRAVLVFALKKPAIDLPGEIRA